MTTPGRPTPKRVRVTSPRRAAARRPATRPLAAEIDEHTALGQVYVQTLVRAQLRLALRSLGLTAIVLGGLLATYLFAPAVHGPRLGPVPVTWLLLGGVSYAFLVAVAAEYLRSTRRLEREFATLVDRG